MSKYYKRIEDFNNEDEYDDYLEQMEDLSIVIYNNISSLVLECVNGKDLDTALKEISGKISIDKLNTNIIKREQEINKLNDLKKKKDPNRIYNSKIELVEEEFASIQLDINETITRGPGIMNIHPNKYYNIKLPQLKEDAKIMFAPDENLMINAGGYEIKKAYGELSAYAKLGL
jgi:hypothetical protein